MNKISKTILTFGFFFMSSILLGSSTSQTPKKIPTPSSDTILFIHGAGSSPKTFEKVAPYFAENFNLLFYDTKRYKPRNSEEGLDGWAQDLELFLEENKVGAVHIISHSFGARLAAKLLEQKPERLQSLIIEDMDFEPRINAGVDTADPMSFPAAISNLGYVFSTPAGNLPILVMGAAKDPEGNAITDLGLRLYMDIEAGNPDFRFVTVDHSTHNIHKSQKFEYLEEIFSFYRDHLKFDQLHIKNQSLSSDDQPDSDKFFQDTLFKFMTSHDSVDLQDMKFAIKKAISKITSLEDLTTLLKLIWSYQETDSDKCKLLSRYFEQSRSFLLKQIYSHNYYEASSYPQEFKVQYSPATHPVTQLEWVLVQRFSNTSMNKTKTYCPESYGELFGQKMCMDHPVENIPFKIIQPYFLDVLNRLKISATMMSQNLIVNLCENFSEDMSNPNILITEENSNNQTQPVKSAQPLTGTQIYDFFGHIQELFAGQSGLGIWGSDFASKPDFTFKELTGFNGKAPGLGFRLMKRRTFSHPKLYRALSWSTQTRNNLFSNSGKLTLLRTYSHQKTKISF